MCKTIATGRTLWLSYLQVPQGDGRGELFLWRESKTRLERTGYGEPGEQVVGEGPLNRIPSSLVSRFLEGLLIGVVLSSSACLSAQEWLQVRRLGWGEGEKPAKVELASILSSLSPSGDKEFS